MVCHRVPRAALAALFCWSPVTTPVAAAPAAAAPAAAAPAEVVLPPGRPLDRGTVEAMLRDALAERGVAGPLALRVDQPALPLANGAGVPITLTLATLDHDPGTGRYQAGIEARLAGGAGGEARTISVAGTVEELVEVPVPTRAIAQGEMLAADLLDARMVPVSSLRAAALVESSQAAIGQEALRPLPAGRALRARDLAPPALVRRGDQVRIVYVQGGLEITAGGVALGPGRRGDAVQVQNGGSGEVRRGVVDGPRRIVVTAVGAQP